MPIHTKLHEPSQLDATLIRTDGLRKLSEGCEGYWNLGGPLSKRYFLYCTLTLIVAVFVEIGHYGGCVVSFFRASKKRKRKKKETKGHLDEKESQRNKDYGLSILWRQDVLAMDGRFWHLAFHNFSSSLIAGSSALFLLLFLFVFQGAGVFSLLAITLGGPFVRHYRFSYIINSFSFFFFGLYTFKDCCLSPPSRAFSCFFGMVA